MANGMPRGEEGGMAKYKFGPNMLEKEDKDKKMHLTKSQMKIAMDSLLAETILFEETQQPVPDRAKISEFKRFQAKLLKEGFKSRIQKEFTDDFVNWLTGRSKFNVEKLFIRQRNAQHEVIAVKEVDGTPWGNKSLQNLPGVTEFLDQALERRAEVVKRLASLKLRTPRDLNEAYIYYKYLVRRQAIDDNDCLTELEEFSDYDNPMVNVGGGGAGAPVDTIITGPEGPSPPRFNATNYQIAFIELYNRISYGVPGAGPGGISWTLVRGMPEYHTMRQDDKDYFRQLYVTRAGFYGVAVTPGTPPGPPAPGVPPPGPPPGGGGGPPPPGPGPAPPGGGGGGGGPAAPARPARPPGRPPARPPGGGGGGGPAPIPPPKPPGGGAPGGPGLGPAPVPVNPPLPPGPPPPPPPNPPLPPGPPPVPGPGGMGPGVAPIAPDAALMAVPGAPGAKPKRGRIVGLGTRALGAAMRAIGLSPKKPPSAQPTPMYPPNVPPPIPGTAPQAPSTPPPKILNPPKPAIPLAEAIKDAMKDPAVVQAMAPLNPEQKQKVETVAKILKADEIINLEKRSSTELTQILQKITSKGLDAYDKGSLEAELASVAARLQVYDANNVEEAKGGRRITEYQFVIANALYDHMADRENTATTGYDMPQVQARFSALIADFNSANEPNIAQALEQALETSVSDYERRNTVSPGQTPIIPGQPSPSPPKPTTPPPKPPTPPKPPQPEPEFKVPARPLNFIIRPYAVRTEEEKEWLKQNLTDEYVNQVEKTADDIGELYEQFFREDSYISDDMFVKQFYMLLGEDSDQNVTSRSTNSLRILAKSMPFGPSVPEEDQHGMLEQALFGPDYYQIGGVPKTEAEGMELDKKFKTLWQESLKNVKKLLKSKDLTPRQKDVLGSLRWLGNNNFKTASFLIRTLPLAPHEAATVSRKLLEDFNHRLQFSINLARSNKRVIESMEPGATNSYASEKEKQRFTKDLAGKLLDRIRSLRFIPFSKSQLFSIRRLAEGDNGDKRYETERLNAGISVGRAFNEGYTLLTLKAQQAREMIDYQQQLNNAVYGHSSPVSHWDKIDETFAGYLEQQEIVVKNALSDAYSIKDIQEARELAKEFAKANNTVLDEALFAVTKEVNETMRHAGIPDEVRKRMMLDFYSQREFDDHAALLSDLQQAVPEADISPLAPTQSEQEHINNLADAVDDSVADSLLDEEPIQDPVGMGMPRPVQIELPEEPQLAPAPAPQTEEDSLQDEIDALLSESPIVRNVSPKPATPPPSPPKPLPLPTPVPIPEPPREEEKNEEKAESPVDDIETLVAADESSEISLNLSDISDDTVELSDITEGSGSPRVSTLEEPYTPVKEVVMRAAHSNADATVVLRNLDSARRLAFNAEAEMRRVASMQMSDEQVVDRGPMLKAIVENTIMKVGFLLGAARLNLHPEVAKAIDGHIDQRDPTEIITGITAGLEAYYNEIDETLNFLNAKKEGERIESFSQERKITTNKRAFKALEDPYGTLLQFDSLISSSKTPDIAFRAQHGQEFLMGFSKKLGLRQYKEEEGMYVPVEEGFTVFDHIRILSGVTVPTKNSEGVNPKDLNEAFSVPNFWLHLAKEKELGSMNAYFYLLPEIASACFIGVNTTENFAAIKNAMGATQLGFGETIEFSPVTVLKKRIEQTLQVRGATTPETKKGSAIIFETSKQLAEAMFARQNFNTPAEATRAAVNSAILISEARRAGLLATVQNDPSLFFPTFMNSTTMPAMAYFMSKAVKNNPIPIPPADARVQYYQQYRDGARIAAWFGWANMAELRTRFSDKRRYRLADKSDQLYSEVLKTKKANKTANLAVTYNQHNAMIDAQRKAATARNKANANLVPQARKKKPTKR